MAFEPGSNFVFPEGEVPAPMPSSFDTLEGVPVAMADFMNADEDPDRHLLRRQHPRPADGHPRARRWRVRLAMARIWADTVNKHGGDVTLVHLPEIGITGNTHFPFSDLNNVEIADQVSQFLEENNLD